MSENNLVYLPEVLLFTHYVWLILKLDKYCIMKKVIFIFYNQSAYHPIFPHNVERLLTTLSKLKYKLRIKKNTKADPEVIQVVWLNP